MATTAVVVTTAVEQQTEDRNDFFQLLKRDIKKNNVAFKVKVKTYFRFIDKSPSAY